MAAGPRVRPACAADLPAIRAVLDAEIAGSTATWRTEPTTDTAMSQWLADRLAAGFPVFVSTAADDGATVAGYGSYGRFRAGDGYDTTVEHSVYVAREHRGQGHGRALVEALAAHARALGMRRMVGGVSADQPGSIALHRACGFAECGRLPGVGWKFGRSLDLVLMVRALDAGPPGQFTDEEGRPVRVR